MTNREEVVKLLLVAMMLIGLIAVALVAAGNLKKMGAYKEDTMLSSYGTKLLNEYDDFTKESTAKTTPEKKVDAATVPEKIALPKMTTTITDANGNVYQLLKSPVVTQEKKLNVVKKKEVVAATQKVINKKGVTND